MYLIVGQLFILKNKNGEGFLSFPLLGWFKLYFDLLSL